MKNFIQEVCLPQLFIQLTKIFDLSIQLPVRVELGRQLFFIIVYFHPDVLLLVYDTVLLLLEVGDHALLGHLLFFYEF